MPRAWARLASGSASTAMTRTPRSVRMRDRAAASVDLPTPPLPEIAIFIKALESVLGLHALRELAHHEEDLLRVGDFERARAAGGRDDRLLDDHLLVDPLGGQLVHHLLELGLEARDAGFA